jgi:hypothetical protein
MLLQALSLFQPFVGLYGNCLEYVQYTGLAKKKSAYIYRRWQFSSSPATPPANMHVGHRVRLQIPM